MKSGFDTKAKGNLQIGYCLMLKLGTIKLYINNILMNTSIDVEYGVQACKAKEFDSSFDVIKPR